MGRMALARAMEMHTEGDNFAMPVEDAWVGVLMARAGIPLQPISTLVEHPVRADREEAGMKPTKPSCKRKATSTVPSVVHQIWLGRKKLRYHRLVSVLSVHFVMRPERHFLYYDEPHSGDTEWECACMLATCVPVSKVRTKVVDQMNSKSDCLEDQVSKTRIDFLHRMGGVYLDLDAYVLQSLERWHQCEAPAVTGLDMPEGKVSHGVIIAEPGASYLEHLRRPACQPPTQQVSAPRVSDGLVHLAPELGALQQQATTAAYDQVLSSLPIAHLAGFKHGGWRHMLDAGVLQRIWGRVHTAIKTNMSDSKRLPAALGRCIAEIDAACWAKIGRRC